MTATGSHFDFDSLRGAPLVRNDMRYFRTCSYYAAFQMSKYVLANFCDVGYKEQDNNSKGQGSHQYVSTVMSNNLEKKNRFYMIDYNRNYKTIKYLRNKADYSTDFIDKEEAKEALESSNGIIRLLISKYCEL